MKTNELRLGNYLSQPEELNGDNYCVVTRISNNMVTTSSKTIDGVIYNVEDKFIILTEEWLVRFGEKIAECATHSAYKVKDIIVMFRHIDCNIFIDLGQIDVEINYIHNFQNIIFYLTGEELTIKHI